MSGDGRNTARGQISEFYFKSMIPGSGNGSKVGFAAHITSIRDSSSPGWSEDFDMGRPDPVMRYGNMSRDVSVSFVVVAVKNEDMDINYNLLKILGNMTYPIYKPNKGYNAPHVMFKIGDLLGGIGVLTSLNYEWSNELPWLGNPPRPLLTEVDLSIKVLTDMEGNRPHYDGGNYNYFGVI